jgi:predicted ester cyclase
MRCLSGLAPLVLLPLLACGTERQASILEGNKALVKHWLQDIDQSQGSLAFIDKWMTSDFRSHAPGAREPLDLEGYRKLVGSFLSGFSGFRREIHQMVAEQDLVSVVMTIHMTNTGNFQGRAPTNKEISMGEAIVARIRDGKIAEEWLVIDSGALQQLAAPSRSGHS